MQFEIDVGAVADKDLLAHMLETLFFEGGKLLEERLGVENNTGANQVVAIGVDETRGEKMEVIRHAIGTT